MSNTSQTSGVKAEDLPQDILDLQTVIRGLPPEHRHKLDPLFGRVLASTVRRRRILNLVQEALGQLRLDMKYLMFDLEATRRERDAYRRQVEGG
ncbi:MAG: transcriptional regulator [Planctomycetes bacterium]|nr:transcriptional regulator [Planctomycetota bacterium]